MPRNHKDDCQCVVCQIVRNKALKDAAGPPELGSEPIPPSPLSQPPDSPEEVALSSLKVGDRYTLNGERFQAGIIDEGRRMVLSLDNPGLGRQFCDPATMVIPME